MEEKHEANRKSILEMVAEFLRELAVLVLVFYPIEDRMHMVGGFGHILIISAVCLSLGIALEKLR